MREKKWDVLAAESTDIVRSLLENRGLRTAEERRNFLDPPDPRRIGAAGFGVREEALKQAKTRIMKARELGERVVVYGDYDVDGISATAVLWEALHGLGLRVMPYIPERISEGYGLNVESIKKLKVQYPDLKLIVTVDNGVVAHEAVKAARKEGVAVIVTDHHQAEKELPEAEVIVHTTEVGGAAVAWLLARELGWEGGMELAALGTVADQIPLLGVNRALVKWGLGEMERTRRLGFTALLREAGAEQDGLGIYEINYVIAPRINAMGRLAHGMDSLRLLCTKKEERARDLARRLGEVNEERQRVVEEAYLRAKDNVSGEAVVISADESYHEGVIGLVASGLVEKFYRPAIVFAVGEQYAKASGRSIAGFNMIETIRQLEEYLVSGGGHPMAAGFTVKTEKLEEFRVKLQEIAAPLLTDEVLERSLKIDLELEFNQINWELVNEIERFEPSGIGNPKPMFCAREVMVQEGRTVGKEGKHLKLWLEQGGRKYGGIGFGLGHLAQQLGGVEKIDVAFNLERNVWNGRESIQLKVRDIKI